MKTKTIVILCLLFAIGGVALAVIVMQFAGWDELTKISSNIIIVKCNRSTSEDAGKIYDIEGGMVESDVNVVEVVKGAAKIGPDHILSQTYLFQGDYYCLFATKGSYGTDEVYCAIEPYRVINLGSSFSSNILSGKSLDEKMQTILKWRLDRLKRELELGQEEKQRLEEGLKK
jgi:hypothetical protein